MTADFPAPAGVRTHPDSGHGFELVDLGPADLGELLDLQAETLSILKGSPVLRENSATMFARCLAAPEHRVLGWRKNRLLVAVAILYDARTSDESVRKYLTSDRSALAASVNLKLVIARGGFRRANLSRSLVAELERTAASRGKQEVLATIHPDNTASRGLFESLGYHEVGQASTSYGLRLIYRRPLDSSDTAFAATHTKESN
ncbi:GNAT family N-acetyltransferase [Gordonia alkaliphila]|uniref:GNAT family N-acetyltransferase n=1 Tax=Gordonia alkaliphila TaxID=1053547 RepID=UPI001FF17CCF|nr:GNAT family N-acetyltransferase [Gordonia alkaliphila]MCK0441082.1 GNAT family N-acetyltransferase [Gordonia alkaliphila]